MAQTIPLIKPYMTDAIRQRVLEVLDSGFLTEGPVTHALEEAFCAYIGIKQAIAVTSATTGLELAVRALQLQPGDEVIVPDFTYPATAMAIANAGAVPVIVDVDKNTCLLDASATAAAIGPKTRALMPVSIFGNPLDYSWIQELKAKHNLFVIEDAACSIGAQWQGKKVGTFADITVFSLHPRKFITSGEGGLIVTDNAELAAWMRSYKRFGMADSSENREGIQFVRTGTNAKLSNVQAAIALGQLLDIELLMQKRQEQAQFYMHLLRNIQEVETVKLPDHAMHSWQTFYIMVEKRDAILLYMREQGVEAQIGTYSMHMHEAFQQFPYKLHGSFVKSRHCFEKTLALPMYHDMTQADQERVVQVLERALFTL